MKVAYRETVGTKAEAEGKYKKQTGGHGQFGVAFLRVEPLERGAGFEFSDAIVGGAIPRQFIPAVERGVADTIVHGGALGFPVVDVKVTCYDGKYHPVDSSEMSFKMAGSLGFKEAAAKAKPVLLEPISELVITVPEAYQGDVMGDLNSKRGRIQGTSRGRQRRAGDQRPGADLGGDPLRHRPPVADRMGGAASSPPTPTTTRPRPTWPTRSSPTRRRPRRADGLPVTWAQERRVCGDPVDGGARSPWRRPGPRLNGAKWSPSRVKMSASRASASSYCFSGRTSWSVVVTTTAQGTSTSGASVPAVVGAPGPARRRPGRAAEPRWNSPGTHGSSASSSGDAVDDLPQHPGDDAFARPAAERDLEQAHAPPDHPFPGGGLPLQGGAAEHHAGHQIGVAVVQEHGDRRRPWRNRRR